MNESTVTTEVLADMPNVTPDAVVSWLEALNHVSPFGFAVLIIAALSILAYKNLPRFLAWLESQTAAMRDIHNELKELRSDINDIKNQKSTQG